MKLIEIEQKSIEIDNHKNDCDRFLSISDICRLINIDFYKFLSILIGYRNYRFVTPWVMADRGNLSVRLLQKQPDLTMCLTMSVLYPADCPALLKRSVWRSITHMNDQWFGLRESNSCHKFRSSSRAGLCQNALAVHILSLTSMIVDIKVIPPFLFIHLLYYLFRPWHVRHVCFWLCWSRTGTWRLGSSTQDSGDWEI